MDHLLIPLGFERNEKNEWIRQVGDYEECVDLQKSGHDGSVTVNLHSVDVVARKILQDAAPAGSPALKWWVNVRISELFSRYDKWWKNDPNGPDEVIKLLKEYGLPFLECMRNPIEQAKRFGLDGLAEPGTTSHTANALWLAVILHRLGRNADACRALDLKRRRHEIAPWVAQIGPLRQYLGCPATENWPD